MRLQNSRYREELLDLSARNLRLSADNGELSARLRGDQESLQMLRERLLTVSKEQEEGVSTASRSLCLLKKVGGSFGFRSDHQTTRPLDH